MATYPGGIHDFSEPGGPSLATDAEGQDTHTEHHEQAEDEIVAIESELGTTPSGTHSDVAGRLDAFDADLALTRNELGVPVGRNAFGLHRYLHDHADERATILVVGDSNGEGHEIASLGDRYLNVYQSLLRDHYGAWEDTGRGYIPAVYGSEDAGTDVAPTVTGTTTEVKNGLGMRGLALHSTGPGTVTWELEGTHAVLCYSSFNLAGKTEYRIDGGDWTEVDHNSGSGLSFREDQLVVDLDASGDDGGEHTLEWRWKADGTGLNVRPIIEGVIEVNGDPLAGVSVLDSCQSGATTAFFNAATTNYLIQQWVSDHNVRLAVIQLGINDWSTGRTVADFAEDLTGLIEKLRDGNSRLEVIVLAGWEPRSSLGTPVAEWSEFVAAMYEVAASFEWVSVLDARDHLPQPDSPGEDGLAVTDEFYDFLAIHIEEWGQEVIGKALYEETIPKPSNHFYVSSAAWRETDISDAFIDPFGAPDPIDLGTDGEALLEWRVSNGVANGWVYVRGDTDADFGSTSTVLAIDPDALPFDLAGPQTFTGGGWARPGAFGFVGPTGSSSFAGFAAIPTVMNLGVVVVAFVLAVPTGAGVGTFLTETNPETLTGESWTYQGGLSALIA